MNFLRKDLKPVHVFKETKLESDYVGTKTADAYSHTVMCNVQSSLDKLTAEIYGERSYNMFTVMCRRGDDVSGKISFTGKDAPTHRIISIKHYTQHSVILAEMIGIGNKL